jgi:hypothetical protein
MRMSKCFTWFLDWLNRRTQYTPPIRLFFNKWVFRVGILTMIIYIFNHNLGTRKFYYYDLLYTISINKYIYEAITINR